MVLKISRIALVNDRRQGGVGHAVHGANVRAARRMSERRVVEDDRDAVRREPHVELDPVRAFADRALERLEGVLGRPPVAAPTPMTENDDGAERARVVGAIRRQTESSSAISFVSFRARSAWSAGREIAPTTGCPPPPKRSQMAAIL